MKRQPQPEQACRPAKSSCLVCQTCWIFQKPMAPAFKVQILAQHSCHRSGSAACAGTSCLQSDRRTSNRELQGCPRCTLCCSAALHSLQTFTSEEGCPAQTSMGVCCLRCDWFWLSSAPAGQSGAPGWTGGRSAPHCCRHHEPAAARMHISICELQDERSVILHADAITMQKGVESLRNAAMPHTIKPMST